MGTARTLRASSAETALIGWAFCRRGAECEPDRSSSPGRNGTGTDSMVIAAIQQAIALQNTYNIRVINLSLGRGISVGYAQDPLCQAVESAWNSGIVVVVAAGNFGRMSVNGSNGYGTVAAPGNDPLVLTVGAMKSMGTYSRTETDRQLQFEGPHHF